MLLRPPGSTLTYTLFPYTTLFDLNLSVCVDLVEGAPRLMPRMPKSTSKAIRRRLRALGVTLHLGKAVQGATADALMVGGKPIRSHTVIWTAGVTNNPFFTENNFAFGPRGKEIGRAHV